GSHHRRGDPPQVQRQEWRGRQQHRWHRHGVARQVHLHHGVGGWRAQRPVRRRVRCRERRQHRGLSLHLRPQLQHGEHAREHGGLPVRGDGRRCVHRHRHRQHRGLGHRVGLRAGSGDRDRDHGTDRRLGVLLAHHGRRGPLAGQHPVGPDARVLDSPHGCEHCGTVQRWRDHRCYRRHRELV
ncbi:MAG: hypothetical protein AVDCRST_MAG83-1739, partial [uncultured Arthrobacter sp.]